MAGDRCELLQSERLSGASVPLPRRLLTTDTPEAFAALTDAFKRYVEAAG